MGWSLVVLQSKDATVDPELATKYHAAGQLKHRSGGWGSAATAWRCLWWCIATPCDRREVDAGLDGDLSSGCQYGAKVAEPLTLLVLRPYSF